MPRYCKKPILIDAFQFAGSFGAVMEWLQSVGYDPATGPAISENADGSLAVATPEGVVRCDLQDYLMRSAEGAFSVSKPDIFAETYDKIVLPEVRIIEPLREPNYAQWLASLPFYAFHNEYNAVYSVWKGEEPDHETEDKMAALKIEEAQRGVTVEIRPELGPGDEA